MPKEGPTNLRIVLSGEHHEERFSTSCAEVNRLVGPILKVPPPEPIHMYEQRDSLDSDAPIAASRIALRRAGQN